MNALYDQNQAVVFLDQRSGLLDISVGLLMLCFGIGTLVEMGWLPAVLIAAMTPIWISINQKLASRVPAGAIEQGEDPGRRLMLVAGLVLVSLLLGVGFFLAFSTGGSLVAVLRANFDAATAVLTAALLAGLGLIFRAARFYAYAWLALGLRLAGAWIGLLFAIPLGILGGLLALTGLVLFLRWLSAHPASVH